MAAGSPPVYIGFGSMVASDPAPLTETVLDAVTRSGVRALLGSGWGSLGAAPRSGRVLLIDEAPHDLLFPRLAATVHHGGAGTTHTALAAGVPSMAVPFGTDQPFWARQIARLGVGPTPIPKRELTAQRLASALRRLTTDQAMRAAAGRIGERIRRENGTARAVELLTRELKQL